MKTVTCGQLGSACDKKFQANSFEEISEMSKKHGMEMYQKGDEAHIRAMKAMQQRMQSPKIMQEWYEQKKRAFDALPDED